MCVGSLENNGYSVVAFESRDYFLKCSSSRVPSPTNLLLSLIIFIAYLALSALIVLVRSIACITAILIDFIDILHSYLNLAITFGSDINAI